jgi:hypothetical protein
LTDGVCYFGEVPVAGVVVLLIVKVLLTDSEERE